MTDDVISRSSARPRKRRDWRTPVLLTLSVHLMVFTLVINHRLFAMIKEPTPGQYVLKVSALNGTDPDDDKQEEDAGAAPGDDANSDSAADASVSDAFNKLATAQVTPRPERVKPVPAAKRKPAPPTDKRTLAERLQSSLNAAGGTAGKGSGGGVGLGGGSHGLRGEGKHGIGLKRNGGSGETEDAVRKALDWLASVQDLDGKWDSDAYMLHYLKTAAAPERAAEGIGLSRNDLGLTGLCLLAFTGAGYSDREGRYKETVRRAREYLLSQQRVQDGGFGLESNTHAVTMYAHSLGTFAITDLYLVNGDERLRTPMRRALNYLLAMQGPGGGWDYDQRYPDKREGWEPSTRDDLSISGWAILALVAAREANFEIPRDNLQRLAAFMKECTRKDGEAVYANKGTRAGSRGMAMLAASNVCRRLLGEPAESWTQQRQRERIGHMPPSWTRAGEVNGSNMYYWYYGTIASLLARDTKGGEDRWHQWNIALKRTLLDHQEQSGGRRGSFDPVGNWARNGGGRVYSTALCTLNLEIYYRYEPAYLRARAGELGYLWTKD